MCTGKTDSMLITVGGETQSAYTSESPEWKQQVLMRSPQPHLAVLAGLFLIDPVSR